MAVMAVATTRFSGGFQRIHETVPGNPKNQAAIRHPATGSEMTFAK